MTSLSFNIATELTETYGVAFTLSNPPQDSLAFIAGSRFYTNLSKVMLFAPPSALAANSRMLNALLADLLASVSRKQYRARYRFRLSLPGLGALKLVAGVLRLLARFGRSAVRAFWSPERALERYTPAVEAYELLSDLLLVLLPLREG